jgi:hypothetical protein
MKINFAQKAVIAPFIDYLQDYYGPGGIYDMGATYRQLFDATVYYLQDNEHPFEGDSFDREHVRAILENRFGLSEYKAAPTGKIA